MKKWAGTLIALLAVVAGGAFLWWQMSQSQASLQLHGQRYHVSVMRTQAELQKGLSGTDSLPEGQAMVFAFASDSKWGMWMKDMNYPIDIVWLNSDRQVVYVVKNAQPSSYPDTTYKPDVPTRYVIELPSGTIERTGIAVGDAAGLPSGV